MRWLAPGDLIVPHRAVGTKERLMALVIVSGFVPPLVEQAVGPQPSGLVERRGV
jgi:hypothetical protein